jgi:hypothetical protein
VHLLLGHPQDPFCAAVRARLEALGHPARIVANPFEPPARFAWRLDGPAPVSRLAWDDATDGAPIAGVLVRSAGWPDPDGWDPADHAYVQAETQAALLAWLAGLPCPVVNRAAAGFFYRPRLPLVAWRPLLRRAGLPSTETLVTNDPQVARDFGRRLEAEGAGGAVCTPLTGETAWLVAGPDWAGLAALQEATPVCLAEPHGPAQSACVVGDRIIWDGAASDEVAALAPGLLRLAGIAGLAFLEVAVAPVRRGMVVVLVDPLPALDRFRRKARDRILDALVGVLTAAGAAARPALEVGR